MKQAICIILLVVLVAGKSACIPKTPVTETSTTPLTSTTVTTELPIVRISDKDYSRADVSSLMRIAENSALSVRSIEWALPNRQVFVDAAIKEAEELGLDSMNLNEIMTKLLLHIDQLDFKGKNVNESGAQWTFMISDKTVQLPYVIEKAKYQGKEAWLMAINWEIVYDDHMSASIGHIAVVVFEYGSNNVLVAMSCA